MPFSDNNEYVRFQMEKNRMQDSKKNSIQVVRSPEQKSRMSQNKHQAWMDTLMLSQGLKRDDYLNTTRANQGKGTQLEEN